MQEEAPSLGKAVLVMREITERPEAVAAGTVILVGTNTDKIIAETKRLLAAPEKQSACIKNTKPLWRWKGSRKDYRITTSVFIEIT